MLGLSNIHFIFIIFLWISNDFSGAMKLASPSMLLRYLQLESAELENLQKNIEQALRLKGVHLHSKSGNPGNTRKVWPQLCISNASNPVDCRISLAPVDINRVCIAPCGCTGSQKWIQYSVANRLRRKDPEQWRICKTCQQPFDFSVCSQRGNVFSSAVSLMLDRPKSLRTGVVAAFVASLYKFQPAIQQLLTSQWFWQNYFSWVRIVHSPILLQFWIGKSILQWFWAKYQVIEKKMFGILGSFEAALIEPFLKQVVDRENLK